MCRIHSPLGHLDRTAHGGSRRHAPARVGVGPFTLIELLVVVAIIAILASMLLPVLARAKESSRRSVCMSQLKNLGIVMESFADDNGGSYPVCYVVHYPGELKWGLPALISSAGPNYPDNPQNCNGTPGFVYEKYGMAQEMLWCPSNQWRRRLPKYQEPFTTWDSGTDPDGGWGTGCYGGDWKCKMEIGYMIVSGLLHGGGGWVYTSNGDGVSGYIGLASWVTTGVAQPAEKQGCERPAEKLLAADSVVRWMWDGSGWPRINHPSGNNGNVSAYQNMLFGDGHVEGRPDAIYVPAVALDLGGSPFLGFQSRPDWVTHDASFFWGKAY